MITVIMMRLMMIRMPQNSYCNQAYSSDLDRTWVNKTFTASFATRSRWNGVREIPNCGVFSLADNYDIT
jgi:hypothetical protein